MVADALAPSLLARRRGLLRPGRRLPSGGLPALHDVVGLPDLYPTALGRLDDLLPGGLLLGPGLEVRLVEPRHGVPDVRVVVYRQGGLAPLVDVSELAFVHRFPVFRIELSHGDSFLFPFPPLLHTLFRPSGYAAKAHRRRDRNPLYAAADPPASGRCPTARGPSVTPSARARPEGK